MCGLENCSVSLNSTTIDELFCERTEQKEIDSKAKNI